VFGGTWRDKPLCTLGREKQEGEEEGGRKEKWEEGSYWERTFWVGNVGIFFGRDTDGTCVGEDCRKGEERGEREKNWVGRYREGETLDRFLLEGTGRICMCGKTGEKGRKEERGRLIRREKHWIGSYWEGNRRN
jgi:hypothetical protein